MINQLQEEYPTESQPPPRLQEYVTYNVKHPVFKSDQTSLNHRAFLTSMSNFHELKTFQEAQS
jgi:hypothetical protein